MGRKITFNLLEGTGTASVPAYGWLSIRPTREYTNGNFLVLAAEDERRIQNGTVIFPDVQPTPTADPNTGKYPWAYIVHYRNAVGYEKSWNVLVPAGTGDLQGSQLVEVVQDDVHYNIMQGPKGDRGDGLRVLGAYQTVEAMKADNPLPKRGDSFLVGSKVWVYDGAAWGASGDLTGAKGDKGNTGNTGTTGATGQKGATGATGVTPAINAIANTGEPGTAASVVKTGTNEAPVLTFTIPRGAQGEQGNPGTAGAKGDKGDTGAPGAGIKDPGSEYGQILTSDGAGNNFWGSSGALPWIATSDAMVEGDANTLAEAKAYTESYSPVRQKNLPEGITDRPGTFNPATFVYTPDSFVGASAYGAIAGSKAANQLSTSFGAGSNDDITTSQVVYMGDSEVVGTGATVGTQDAAAQAMAQLRSAGYAMSDGLIVCYDNNKDAGLTNRDSRLAMTGTWTVGGIKSNPAALDYQYHVRTTVAASTLTFTFSQATTRIELYLFGNSTAFDYQVDSGTVNTYTPSGTSSFETLRINGLSSATHTLKVTAKASPNLYIFGARGFTAYSSDISKLGFWGAFSPAGLPRTWWSGPAYLKHAQPNSVVLQYGTNEALKGGYTIDQYKGLMLGLIASLRSTIPGVAVYLMSSFQPNVSNAVWTNWRNAQYDIADMAGIRLGDCVAKVGNRTTATAAGLYSDATHPNSAGYAKQGELLRQMLLTP